MFCEDGRCSRRLGEEPHWGALHLVLGYAARRGVIADDPAASPTSSERPRRGSSRRRFLSRMEIEQLLDVVPDHYRVAVMCSLFSGLRLSVLLGLTWRDVDFDRGVIEVTHQLTRGGSRQSLETPAARRDVVLMPELAPAMRRHRLA